MSFIGNLGASKRLLIAERKRLNELETKGTDALSHFDIYICNDGNKKKALEEALRLVKAHISYYENELKNVGEDLNKWIGGSKWNKKQ
jgi:hypothetical protein